MSGVGCQLIQSHVCLTVCTKEIPWEKWLQTTNYEKHFNTATINSHC